MKQEIKEWDKNLLKKELSIFPIFAVLILFQGLQVSCPGRCREVLLYRKILINVEEITLQNHNFAVLSGITDSEMIINKWKH